MDYPCDYLTAINEFEALDEKHKEPYLYALLGYSLYLSQNTEKLLMNIIWGNKVVNRKDETNEELNHFFDKYEFGRHTLGALVNDVKKILSLPINEYNKLVELLKQRNYIVHNYFKINDSLLYIPNGYKIIIRDFLTFINSANELESMLEIYLFQYFEKVGYSKEKLHLEFEAEIEKWRQTQIDSTYQSSFS